MATVETVRPRLTFADLERMPDDGRRYELYDGEVVVVPAPLPLHQIVHSRLVEIFLGYASARGGLCLYAPLDIVFSDYDVLQPDIVYFGPERRGLIDLKEVIRYPPDLCVEVLSPSTARRDRGKKMQTFARFGVNEYWIVDPAALVLEQYELIGDSYQLRIRGAGDDCVISELLPGLEFPVREIFRDIERA
jgi:Uma2 family endonuclease